MRLSILTGIALYVAAAHGLRIGRRQYPGDIQSCINECGLTDYNCQASCFSSGGGGQSPLVECVNSCETGIGNSEALREYQECMSSCAGLSGPTSAGGDEASSTTRVVATSTHDHLNDDDDDDAATTESSGGEPTATERRESDPTSATRRAGNTGVSSGSDGGDSNGGSGGGGDNGKSLGLGLGLGLGLALLLGIIALVIFLVWRTKRKDKAKLAATTPVMGHHPDTTGSPGVYKPELDSTTSAVSPESKYTSPQTVNSSTTPPAGFMTTTSSPAGYQAELDSATTVQTYPPELGSTNTQYRPELDPTSAPMSQYQQYRPDAELSGQSAPVRQGELVGDVPMVRHELGNHQPHQGPWEMGSGRM